jgi:hypothetical protein
MCERTLLSDKAHYMKVYEYIWRNLERENTLISYRTQWAISLSAGLAVTQGLIASGLKIPNEAHVFIVDASLLLTMSTLSLVAIFFSDRARNGVRAAVNQVEYLKSFYYSPKFVDLKGFSLFEKELDVPRPFGDPKDHISGNYTARIFPTTLVSIWVVFFVLEFVGTVCCAYAGISMIVHPGP